MTQSFAAQVQNWSEKAKRNAELVVRGAAQDVAELASIPRDGIVRGAPFQVGVVPVDQGQLIGSLTVEINGGLTGTGNAASATPPDYSAALAGFEIGDVVQVAFSAPYARAIEYGANGVPGRFMVRGAVQQWQAVVDANAALFKD